MKRYNVYVRAAGVTIRYPTFADKPEDAIKNVRDMFPEAEREKVNVTGVNLSKKKGK